MKTQLAARSLRRMPLSRLPLLAALVLLAVPAARAADTTYTESRMPFRHVIPLRDANGDMITLPAEFDAEGKPQEPKAPPFSVAQTCGRCHEYPSISQGWHFNAGRDSVPSGRPGEPWILTDAATRTQIPVSYRGWEGTYKPGEVGLSDFDFLLAFGRHHPGGGKGEPSRESIDTTDARMRRFLVTGGLEIDCLICHNKHGHYDHEARYKAIANENFKWSPTIASELGAYSVSRPARAFADSWRPPRPAPTNLPPVKYERHRFDQANHVTVDVTRRAASENCYFCHTSESHLSGTRWHSDRDVHLRAGMACVDCHRNSIDHQIVRGYEGESSHRVISDDAIALRAKMLLRDDPSLKEPEAKTRAESRLKEELARVDTLSCRGCHYGSADGRIPGRLGAPEADHHGLPPIHFEKLACTACHSGPIPGNAAEIVHTSLAHKLGIPGPMRGENTAPGIVQPVFIRDGNGQIAPHKMVWPSFWGYLRGDTVKPILPAEIARIAGDKMPAQPKDEVERDPYNTRPLTDAQIREVLAAFPADGTNGVPVFVASGRLYKIEAGALSAAPHAAAEPYAWPVGHDVRPASQALGVKGCADCHDEDSPIYFASVAARGPVDPTNSVTKAQWELRQDDVTLARTFAFTFNFRPMLKIVTFACALIVLGTLLGRILLWLGGQRARNDGD